MEPNILYSGSQCVNVRVTDPDNTSFYECELQLGLCQRIFPIKRRHLVTQPGIDPTPTDLKVNFNPPFFTPKIFSFPSPFLNPQIFFTPKFFCTPFFFSPLPFYLQNFFHSFFNLQNFITPISPFPSFNPFYFTQTFFHPIFRTFFYPQNRTNRN